MAEDPKWESDAEYQRARASIGRAAEIMRERGARHFDPRAMGSPIEHTLEEIEVYAELVESEEREFLEREVYPRQEKRLKCSDCRREMFGLCDVHARMLRQHDWADIHPDVVSDSGEYVVTLPCVNPEHGPKSARWTTVYSHETKRDEGRCSCRDRVVKVAKSKAPKRPKRRAALTAPVVRTAVPTPVPVEREVVRPEAAPASVPAPSVPAPAPTEPVTAAAPVLHLEPHEDLWADIEPPDVQKRHVRDVNDDQIGFEDFDT
jgi:hypothetical protein